MPPTDPEMRFPTPFRGFAEQPVSGQFPTAEFPNGIGLEPDPAYRFGQPALRNFGLKARSLPNKSERFGLLFESR